MRLRVMASMTAIILLIWLGAWLVGLPSTQWMAAMLAVPYAGFTAYLAYARVRTR
jgi:hypothetical protein